MTGIQIAVVAALMFFAAISVVIFILWKRETQMRTNSIRFIEDTLINIRDGLTENNELVAEELLKQSSIQDARTQYTGQQPASPAQAPPQPQQTVAVQDAYVPESRQQADLYTDSRQYSVPDHESRNAGPSAAWHPDGYSSGSFADKGADMYSSGMYGAAYADSSTDTGGEINLDFIDQDMDFRETGSQYVSGDDWFRLQEQQMMRDATGQHSTGRSGRTYTVSELETLIRE